MFDDLFRSSFETRQRLIKLSGLDLRVIGRFGFFNLIKAVHRRLFGGGVNPIGLTPEPTENYLLNLTGRQIVQAAHLVSCGWCRFAQKNIELLLYFGSLQNCPPIGFAIVSRT